MSGALRYSPYEFFPVAGLQAAGKGDGDKPSGWTLLGWSLEYLVLKGRAHGMGHSPGLYPVAVAINWRLHDLLWNVLLVSPPKALGSGSVQTEHTSACGFVR